MLSPQSGRLETSLRNHLSQHSADVTKPYYYSTRLDRYNICTELVPAHYSAMYRFTFDNPGRAYVLFDASQAIASDIVPRMHGKVKLTDVSIDSKTRTIRMHLRYQGGWIDGSYDVYCVAKCDRPFADWGTWHGDKFMEHQTQVGSVEEDTLHTGAYCDFTGSKQVLVKLAVSFVSIDRAEQLLDEEIPKWNFDYLRQQARDQWNRLLSTIDINTPDADKKTIFYSGLFRAFTAISDRSKDNPHNTQFTTPYYDDNYAYWDTFRTLYPLLTLVDEPVVTGNLNTIIDIFARDGNVYDGFICGRSRHAEQGGNDVDEAIVDAYLKGVHGVDWQKAYEIIKYHADHGRQGNDRKGLYRNDGFIPEGTMSNSQTLEYAYNDYSAALMAKGLGHSDEYKRLLKRSAGWQALWNPDLENQGYKGFIDAKRNDGTFAFLDVTQYGGSWSKPFYEGNSWTYSYYVPHNFETLIRLMGGPKTFVDRLDYGFRHGLVKYDNEPGFLAPFAFTHAGRPDKTSYWVHDLMAHGYDLTGYPGNDDTGSMGSWFAFATLGIFPNAGQDFYYLSAPAVTDATMSLSNGRKLRIKANASPENVYIKSCRFVTDREMAKGKRGQVINNPIIRHKQIAEGGTLVFELTDTPTSWGQ